MHPVTPFPASGLLEHCALHPLVFCSVDASAVYRLFLTVCEFICAPPLYFGRLPLALLHLVFKMLPGVCTQES